ncbi:hypothetical protein QBC44DRAFT_333343 [Cladorrhinum sp. PSN332]|nr:hypothetical protein QBC44DRAFT_333343 [Cladorrhinum sp. PSN332]
MPSYHSILIQFKEDATEDNKMGTYYGFVSLLHDCHHPADNEPYISSIQIGNNTAVDEAMTGYTYVFTVQFICPSDRKWFVNGDPVARRHIRKIEHLMDKVETVDFESEVEGLLVNCAGSSGVRAQFPPPENSCLAAGESEVSGADPL